MSHISLSTWSKIYEGGEQTLLHDRSRSVFRQMIVVMYRPVCIETHTGTNNTGKRWRFVDSGSLRTKPPILSMVL